MHSGMRGDPHVGALRRCSFTNTESNSIAIHEHLPQALLLVKHTNRAHGDPLSVLPATAAFRVFQDRLLNKPHTLTIRHEFLYKLNPTVSLIRVNS